jgi:3'-5' exoribonuclease
MADNFDAKMETFKELLAHVPEGNVEWQGYNRLLESNIRRAGV